MCASSDTVTLYLNSYNVPEQLQCTWTVKLYLNSYTVPEQYS